MKIDDADIPMLIVDDQKTMRRIVRKLLADVGCENVEEASDGTAALELLRRKSFKLIISDLNMAPMNGLELLQEVRTDISLRDVPFVMMTTENATQHAIAAKQLGATTYIVKPFKVSALREAIEAALVAQNLDLPSNLITGAK